MSYTSMMESTPLTVSLSAIFTVVLLAPFLNRTVESNLEMFLFIMGALTASISNAWTVDLIHEAVVAPIGITLAVFAAGMLFHRFRQWLDHGMRRLLITVPLPAVVCAAVIVLALLSSVISAIIAALLLVEFITVLPLNRKAEVGLTVIACFAIGLGAVLTPLGEPLSTIVVSKLNGAPYFADFFYLARFLGAYVIVGVCLLGIVAIFLVGPLGQDTHESLAVEPHPETVREVFFRAFKVYVFVMALIFLGAGFKPLIDGFLIKLSSQVLFWVNMVSAVLDNATLAAAEIGPGLTEPQIKSVLLGLLISGGMLIPGNIPNIIAAHSLRITSTEWAQIGVPLGLVMMAGTATLLFYGVL